MEHQQVAKSARQRVFLRAVGQHADAFLEEGNVRGGGDVVERFLRADVGDHYAGGVRCEAEAMGVRIAYVAEDQGGLTYMQSQYTCTTLPSASIKSMTRALVCAAM